MFNKLVTPHPLSPKQPDTADVKTARDLENEEERNKARRAAEREASDDAKKP